MCRLMIELLKLYLRKKKTKSGFKPTRIENNFENLLYVHSSEIFQQ